MKSHRSSGIDGSNERPEPCEGPAVPERRMRGIPSPLVGRVRGGRLQLRQSPVTVPHARPDNLHLDLLGSLGTG